MRQISSYTPASFGRWVALAELVHKPRKFEQIRHAEERTVLAYDDFRIRGGKIRPLRQNRADRHLIHLQQQTLAVNVVALAHANELLAVQRMKRVRDAYKARP